MKFEPFIASKLLGPRRKEPFFDVPVQLSLFPETQTGMNFALRLHDASYLHYDFRIHILRTLFCLVLFEAPSLDPARRVGAKLMGDHDPSFLEREYVIPFARRGAGPTMPVDLGRCVPLVKRYSTYEQEMLGQIARRDCRFTMSGRFLRGAWRLFSRDGEYWNLCKLEDEYASTDRVLSLNRSITTGNTLEELRHDFDGR